jgi:glucosyl-3-phosphoglycerate synthase
LPVIPQSDRWARRRSFHHSEFSPERIARERAATVSICIPARNEAATIGAIVEVLADLRRRGVIDQIVVADDSTDGTAAIAHAAGAEVHSQSRLRSDLGPVRGKGDAMWRALHVLDGEVVAFVDGDTSDFDERFVCGLVGPLVCADPAISFVKGFYERPFRDGDVVRPTGGGRVTELLARPVLESLYPDLAAIRQPLAGEIAARRDLLRRLPFATGYSVDIALLIDAWAEVGLAGLAQSDLDVRQNDHQDLDALGDMSRAVLAGVLTRLWREGRLAELPPEAEKILERPPLSPVALPAAG